MSVIGNLLKRGIRIGSLVANRKKLNSYKLQKKTLAKLLAKARYTEFGVTYKFEDILSSLLFEKEEQFYEKYKTEVPVYDYNKIYQEWWHRVIQGETNVTWPGKVNYFALSSGTSDAASKQIPVSKAMSKAIQRASIRLILSLGNYKDLPDDLYEKGFLMLGGSTDLNTHNGSKDGDLSGITASQIPFWFRPYYKPGQKIASERNWALKLEEITREAKNWDIGFIVGVPAWLQLLMEKIIAHYNVKNIHEIWPNLQVFAHGGVSFEPYKKSFEKLLGKPLIYIETYLASEGFLAYQTNPESKGMRLAVNNEIFFEFIPFNESNFDADGGIIGKPETFMIHEVEEGRDYAILISTCSGAWRYLIGDTVRFVNKDQAEIIITGRTKHFLSLCGEHLSIDNMNKAIDLLTENEKVDVKEFTVIGTPHNNMFAHHWFIGTEETADPKLVRERLDGYLKQLNDDYAVERQHALKDVFVTMLPNHVFYDYMEARGKIGGQNKFPRVLKKQSSDEWINYLRQKGYLS